MIFCSLPTLVYLFPHITKCIALFMFYHRETSFTTTPSKPSLISHFICNVRFFFTTIKENQEPYHKIFKCQQYWFLFHLLRQIFLFYISYHCFYLLLNVFFFLRISEQVSTLVLTGEILRSFLLFTPFFICSLVLLNPLHAIFYRKTSLATTPSKPQDAQGEALRGALLGEALKTPQPPFGSLRPSGWVGTSATPTLPCLQKKKHEHMIISAVHVFFFLALCWPWLAGWAGRRDARQKANAGATVVNGYSLGW